MIKRIFLDEKEIVLVGTAHISKESMGLVTQTIEQEKPDVIGVELDRERLEQLVSGRKWEQTNIIDIVKKGKTYLFLLNTLLSNFQKQLGAKVGVKPGSEMMVAVKKAGEEKIPIQLLDRNVRITLKRAFNKMSLKEKFRLGSSLFLGFFGKGEKVTINAKSIEDLKDKDLINKLMKELGKQMPSMKEVLVDERDSYIAQMIRNSPGEKIVAVVGAGHLEGIEKLVKSKKKISLKKLNEIPEKKSIMKFLKYAIPTIFISFFIYLFLIHGIQTTLQALLIWFLANGTLSAIGAAVSLAHPLTIATAFLAAPITSLNPAIAAGWVAAITETKLRPPRIIDFKSMSKISNFKGYYENRVTHILIVTALTNVGSTIGTVFAIPFLLQLL